MLGISRQHLYDIMAERKPVSPEVAVRFGKLFGDGAGVWVRQPDHHGALDRIEIEGAAVGTGASFLGLRVRGGLRGALDASSMGG